MATHRTKPFFLLVPDSILNLPLLICGRTFCAHSFTFLLLLPSLLSVDVGVSGILLYELSARLHVVAHEHGEYLVGLCGVLDSDLL